jgi:hypothetical protein
MIEIAAQYTFGMEGSARPYLREGWSHREADFTWTEGTRSRIVLPYEAGDGQVVLEISLNPLLFKPIVPRQRVLISVNGHEVADETLIGESTLGLDVPGHMLAGATTLDIVLDCPSAAIPISISMSSDDRQLGLAVREILVFRAAVRAPFKRRTRAPLPQTQGGVEAAVRGLTGHSIPDLAACFASLGHNCEFGLVQRAMGAEVLGLLRFVGIPIRSLVNGLDLGFEGLEEPGNLLTFLPDAAIATEPARREFLVWDRRYEITAHTDMREDETTPERVLQTYYRHLGFLRRKFVEDLQDGRRIFVFQHPAARSAVQVRAILNLLRSHGPNTLLFVTDDRTAPPGTVEQIEEDLLHGTVEALAPVSDAGQFHLPSWISVCANAYRLWRESGRGET